MNTIIKRRVLVSMLFIGLVLMGIFSYKHLPMELYPNAELPVLSVSISSETESDPSYIENQVAIPVEGAVSALNGVEKIETQIYSRGGQVTVSFKQDVDLKYTFLQLEEKIKSITPNLPDNFRLNVNKSSSGSASDMFMNLRILGEDDIDYVTFPIQRLFPTWKILTESLMSTSWEGDKKASKLLSIRKDARL